jgi:hypothetical protein
MNQKHNVTVPGLGLTFSTGSIAQLAGGAVNVYVGETNVFVSACVAQTMRPGQDFSRSRSTTATSTPQPAASPAATSSARVARASARS